MNLYVRHWSGRNHPRRGPGSGGADAAAGM